VHACMYGGASGWSGIELSACCNWPLCLHCRDFPPNFEDWDDEDDVVTDMVLLGIVGIQDPVRPEVSQHGGA
jgi:magnesium-transporting ATPase (P-type)